MTDVHEGQQDLLGPTLISDSVWGQREKPVVDGGKTVTNEAFEGRMLDWGCRGPRESIAPRCSGTTLTLALAMGRTCQRVTGVVGWSPAGPAPRASPSGQSAWSDRPSSPSFPLQTSRSPQGIRPPPGALRRDRLKRPAPASPAGPGPARRPGPPRPREHTPPRPRTIPQGCRRRATPRG